MEFHFPIHRPVYPMAGEVVILSDGGGETVVGDWFVRLREAGEGQFAVETHTGEHWMVELDAVTSPQACRWRAKTRIGASDFQALGPTETRS